MPPEVQDPPQNASSPQVVADVLQWDVRNWSEALRFWERSVEWRQVHNCLELGGREGGLSLWLALHGKNVVCSDYEDTRERAREHHQKYQLGANIEYATIDAVSIPYENHFDVIAFKSMLGAVGGGNDKQRQQLAIDQMHKALKPGGFLLFAENMAGSADPDRQSRLGPGVLGRACRSPSRFRQCRYARRDEVPGLVAGDQRARHREGHGRLGERVGRLRRHAREPRRGPGGRLEAELIFCVQ